MPELSMTPARISLIAVSAILAGCATTMLVPIADNQQAPIVFGDNGPENASEGGVTVERAGLEPNAAAKAMNYVFDFTVSDNRAPRSVIVEDVTADSEKEVLAEDTRPFLASGRWHFVTPSRTAAEPDLAWLMTIEAGMRIYRFTVVTADGRTLVLYQASQYSGEFKSRVRRALGLDY
jgi:hypothetical protein